MSQIIKFFIFLQLSVQFLSVVSYTLVLKQVKTLQPSVKVYRYDLRHPKLLPETSAQYIYHKPLLGQRIYPVPFKHRDANTKHHFPPKKEGKAKHHKAGEKPAFRDHRQQGLSQHLIPPVSNQIEEYSEAKEEEDEVRPLVASPGLPNPPTLGKSFSSFRQEKGKIHGTPGEWATPAPQVDSENTTKAEFTPSQLYLQIRHKNTVIHVPQSEALKDAETLEELINAPRLKELARTTHVQETYSEEGYEDAGYDHAGHIRQAQHGEVYDAKDEGRFKIKDPPVIIDYDSDLEESQKAPLKDFKGKEKDSVGENVSNKLEPRITRSRAEVSKTSVEYAKTPKNYKGDHKYSSRVKGPTKGLDAENGNPFNATETKDFPAVQATFPSYFGEIPPTLGSILANDSAFYHTAPSKKSSKYRKVDLNSTKIYPVTESPDAAVPLNGYTDFKPYISLIDSQASPSTKSLKYSRIYSKKTKQLRLEPYTNENILSPPPPPSSYNLEPPPPPEELQPPRIENGTAEESINQRIVLPTIGYINSLTTAHFGKDSSETSQEESKGQLTDALNLTQALDYLRSKKNQKTQETTKSPTEIDIRTFESMKLKKSRPPGRSFVGKSKRDVHLVKSRGRRSELETEEYEGNDESDAPHNEKNKEIAEDERRQIEEENLEKAKYEEDLRQEISKKEEEILKETYKNIGVEENISEVFPELPYTDSEPEFSSRRKETTPTPVNVRKYPFYLSKRLPENSPLRYATDPKQFPKKSGYKMEFYDSREHVIQCPDFHPDLEDLPNSNSTEYSEDQPGENQRLSGLGNKIACLRMKYFDPEPFDNPIFKEKEIDYVGKPRDPKKIRVKITPKSSKVTNKELQQPSHQKFFPSKNKRQKPIYPSKNHAIPEETRANPISLPNEPNTQLRNKSETHRIIPVTEVLSDVPPRPIAAFSNPPIFWKTTYRSKNFPQIQSRLSNTPKPPLVVKLPPKSIVLPRNCLHDISKLSLLDGRRNLTIDCRDATLIQEVIGNAPRLRIIPKERREEKKQVKKNWSEPIVPPKDGEESDWVPIVGHPAPKQFTGAVSRRSDEVKKLQNETGHNTSSNHYVIDELKEEENVRKGEVVEDMDHYMKLMAELEEEETEVTAAKEETATEKSSRRRREAENGFVRKGVGASEGGGSEKGEVIKTEVGKLRPKRPLARLSGIDFLIRYHKNKAKHMTEKSEDFWRVTNKPQKKQTETEKPVRSIPKPTENSRTTSVRPGTETNTKTSESKEFSVPQQKGSSAEKTSKFKIKQTEPRKISPLNLIPEKITKRPEVKSTESWKTTTDSLNSGKIVMTVSREMSQSTDKPRIVHRPKTSTETIQTSSIKAGLPEYKTINRNTNSLSSESTQSSTSTDDSEDLVLYYVVNLKTGRGKWITNYEEGRRGSSPKHQQNEKGKENPGGKRYKRRKKHKY